MTEPIKPISPISRVQDRQAEPPGHLKVNERLGELVNLHRQYPGIMSGWILKHPVYGEGILKQFIQDTGLVRIEFNDRVEDYEPTAIISAKPPLK